MTQPVADEQAPAIIEQSQAVTFAIPLEEFRQNLEAIKTVVHEYLIEDEDFGKIPGTNKPTLLKSGAEKLGDLYGFAPTFHVTHRIEDWTRPSLTGMGIFPFIHYEFRCDLLRRSDGALVASGVGACSSMEAKYRWRQSNRRCPQCNAEAIIKGKAEYGGGWLCFQKKGGCGAKFKDGESVIVDQSIGKVENEDIGDAVNTILKMASKRALIDATLHATRSSSLFTQDAEDMPTADAPFVEGSYRNVDEDAPPPAAQPQTNGKPPNERPMTQAQLEYLFGGGAAPLDQALAMRYVAHVGGIAGAEAAMKDGTMPTDISHVLKYSQDGKLSWDRSMTEAQASAAITAIKGVLGVGEKAGDALKAFWAKANELKLSKDDVHIHYRVPLDDGELKKYVADRAKQLKMNQAGVWNLMRQEIIEADEKGELSRGHRAPAEPDVPFA